MIENAVGKTCGAMAHAAVLGGGNMIGRLPNSPRPNIIPIVARDTIARDTDVIEDLWRECRVRMARGTILVRRQMVCRLDNIRIGGKEPTDMTTLATTRNVLMKCSKKRCRGKNIRGIVTDAAIILCRNVINLLGSCDASGMA